MTQHCPTCQNTDLIIKKFTVGTSAATAYDFFCPRCGTLETVNCDEIGWDAALSRWLGGDRAATPVPAKSK